MVDRMTAARVLARDGFRCRNCGREEALQIDHIIARTLGGTDDLDNLQVLCKTCNVRKGIKDHVPAAKSGKQLALIPAVRAALNPPELATLRSVTNEIRDGEADMSEARRLRLHLLDAARKQEPPVTWRRLVEVTGASEPFLRRILNEYRATK